MTKSSVSAKTPKETAPKSGYWQWGTLALVVGALAFSLVLYLDFADPSKKDDLILPAALLGAGGLLAARGADGTMTPPLQAAAGVLASLVAGVTGAIVLLLAQPASGQAALAVASLGASLAGVPALRRGAERLDPTTPVSGGISIVRVESLMTVSGDDIQVDDIAVVGGTVSAVATTLRRIEVTLPASFTAGDADVLVVRPATGLVIASHVASAAPGTQADPGAPAGPDTPAGPNTPAGPDTPAGPAGPDTPAGPDAPAGADAPAGLAAPAGPDAPAGLLAAPGGPTAPADVSPSVGGAPDEAFALVKAAPQRLGRAGVDCPRIG